MSVYTPVSKLEIQRFLDRYTIGELLDYQGIDEGIENTNYFVNTVNGRYVLTLFEHQSLHDLPYFLDLMAYVAEAGLPAPHPIADQHGTYLQELCGKPAALIVRLEGHTEHTLSVEHCERVGNVLACMHLATDNFKPKGANKRDLVWCESQSKKVLPRLAPEEAELLRSEICHQQKHPLDETPQGTIHADLFRDNILFNQHRLTGVIDFYYACNDSLLYDLAITVNDWCVETDGTFDASRYQAMVQAYCQRRPPTWAEPGHWQNALRRAALRFWLSRLGDKHFPRPGEMTHIKNPDFFRDILIKRRQKVPELC